MATLGSKPRKKRTTTKKKPLTKSNLIDKEPTETFLASRALAKEGFHAARVKKGKGTSRNFLIVEPGFVANKSQLDQMRRIVERRTGREGKNTVLVTSLAIRRR